MTNRNLFEVYVMNLGTDRGDYFTVGSLQDLAEAEDIVNPKGWNDVEVQLIDVLFECEKCSFDITDFLRIYDEFNIKAEELGALFSCQTASEIREVLEKGLHYEFQEATSKESAFQGYIMENNLLEIPEHLEGYISWGRVLRDWEASGLHIEKVGKGQHPMNDKYLILNTY